jgi:hypothetical protein
LCDESMKLTNDLFVKFVEANVGIVWRNVWYKFYVALCKLRTENMKSLSNQTTCSFVGTITTRTCLELFVLLLLGLISTVVFEWLIKQSMYKLKRINQSNGWRKSPKRISMWSARITHNKRHDVLPLSLWDLED